MSDHIPPDQPELSPAELAHLADMRDLASELSNADRILEEPPAGLWDSIEAELAQPTLQATTAIGTTETPRAAETSIEAESSGGVVIQGPWAKAKPWALGAIAAAAALVAGTAIYAANNDADPVAEVALSYTDGAGFDPLGAESIGFASLLDDDNNRCLDLELDNLPSVDGAILELWLIDTNVENMVSLGEVDGNSCINVPDSVNPAELPVVDISIEPNDGVETHSGRSILRGVLDLEDL